MPVEAAPFLSFVDNSDDMYKGISRLITRLCANAAIELLVSGLISDPNTSKRTSFECVLIRTSLVIRKDILMNRFRNGA